jgi:hypothetical protein
MSDFTIVLPIRGTDRELKFMKRSIESAINLVPGEIIFGTDSPLNPDVKSKIIEICFNNKWTSYRILEFEKDKTWKFQLANVVWNCYQQSKYDKILSFDIDSALRKEVMIGYDIVGKNNVAVCSFTKKLLLRSLFDLQRYLFYRLRVKQSNYVFSGVYWVHRPFYLENIKIDELKKISNGVDTLMTNEILNNNTHRIVTRKEKGVNCMDIQNEDYPWRQFQVGVWIKANDTVRIKGTVIKKKFNKTSKGFLSSIIYGMMSKVVGVINEKGWVPFIYIMIKSFMYGHPHLISGYRWAKKNPENKAVKLAKTMSYDEWGYRGGEIITMIGKKFKRMDGTGF